MDDLFRLTHILTPFYHGKNYLYKNPKTGEYYLVVSKSQHTPEEFNKVCNILDRNTDLRITFPSDPRLTSKSTISC